MKNTPTTKRISGSEALMLSLLAEDVDTIFGYPGGAIMPVFDSLYDYTDRFRFILTRHEQGAGHMAQGYARVSRKPGVAIVTSGPGATNLLTSLADAMIDSTPMVCISGQVVSSLLGTDAFQETDIIGMSMPITKWNYQITTPEEVPDAIAKAFYIARSGRPGPVLIDFTKNAQLGTLDFSYKPCHFIRSYVPFPKVQPEKIEQAANLLNSAKRPMILVGQGVLLAQAEEELKAFVEKTGIPAASTLMGLSALPTDHPLNIGMLGMHGNYGPNKMTAEADVIIAMGMRFDDRVAQDVKKFAAQAQIIHMEIDPSEVSKNILAHIPVLGDLKQTLPLLTRACKGKAYPEWMQTYRGYHAFEEEKVIRPLLYPSTPEITMAEAVRVVNERTKGEAVVVTDVGQHQMITARYAKLNTPRSFITSGGLGTMGYGLPAAVGAKLGAPEKDVVLFVGDGGIQMTIQELGTIMESNVGVKIVVLNNGFLGMVRQWQELFHGGRYSSTPMMSPDFVAIAAAYKIPGRKVSKRTDLSGAVDTLFSTPGAYLLEVMVGKEDNVFPMIPAGKSVDDIRFA